MSLCECGCGQETKVSPYTSTKYGWVKGQSRRFLSGHNQRGVTLSEATKAKLSGEGNGQWRGGDVAYTGIHIWLAKNKSRTGVCEICGSTPEPYKGKTVGTDFANISGEYRRDVDDYLELCRACHIVFDRSPDSRRAKRLTKVGA